MPCAKVCKKNNIEYISDSISDSIIDIAEKLVKKDGAHNITVRKILDELGTKNRVFYNRFTIVVAFSAFVLDSAQIKQVE